MQSVEFALNLQFLYELTGQVEDADLTVAGVAVERAHLLLLEREHGLAKSLYVGRGPLLIL